MAGLRILDRCGMSGGSRPGFPECRNGPNYPVTLCGNAGKLHGHCGGCLLGLPFGRSGDASAIRCGISEPCRSRAHLCGAVLRVAPRAAETGGPISRTLPFGMDRAKPEPARRVPGASGLPKPDLSPPHIPLGDTGDSHVPSPERGLPQAGRGCCRQFPLWLFMRFSWALICDSSLGMGYPERWIVLVGDRCATPPDGPSVHNARYAMRDTGLAAFRFRSGDNLHSRRPPCEAVQAAGGNFIPVCRPSGHGTLDEYLHGAAGDPPDRGPGFGQTFPPIPADGRSAPARRRRCLSTTRPEVGTARPGGKMACRNGFVTDPDVTNGNVAGINACGCARRRIGNGTFNVPGTDGYDPGHNFGRGGPANLPVVPDPPAIAAHTARDPGEAARQRARRTPGAGKRPSGHMRPPAAHVVLPSWTGPVATPVTGVPPPGRRLSPPPPRKAQRSPQMTIPIP